MGWQVGNKGVMLICTVWLWSWRWNKCERDVLVKGLCACMIGVFSDWCVSKNDVWECGRVCVCKPVLSFHQAYVYNKRAFPNPWAYSHIPNIPNSFLSSAASLTCRWRASAPLSTSESCCLWCRPLEEALWMADCGCHSLLGTRDRWTRCVARCGFRRRRPPWSCGKQGCRSSCSWCSCAASCARPGIRRCRAIRWPLWQG